MEAGRSNSGFKGTRLTRNGRYSESNRVYHVTTTTFERKRLFRCLECGRFAILAMRAQAIAGNATTLAFVVMPDHLHWLLRLTGNSTLPSIMNSVKSGAARRITRHHGRPERVWQKGFYDRAIRCEEDLEDVARYIVTNPLRAGLVKSLSQYPLWDAIWV